MKFSLFFLTLQKVQHGNNWCWASGIPISGRHWTLQKDHWKALLDLTDRALIKRTFQLKCNRAGSAALFGIAAGSGVLFIGECLPPAKVRIPTVHPFSRRH